MAHKCGSKFYSVAKLFQHLSADCPEKYRICPICKDTLETADANRQHIRTECALVEIQCDTCSKLFSRDKFREHICYVKYKNFRDVIELKHDVNLKLTDENKTLAAEVKTKQEELESDKANYETKVR